MWATRALSRDELGEQDYERRMHLEWPRFVIGHNDESYEYPEPSGISGGGVWSLNIGTHGSDWHPRYAQLAGIEFAVQKGSGYRYLLAQQIHVWLEMVAEDIPELAPTINAHLIGTKELLSSHR